MAFKLTTQPFFGSDTLVALPDGRDPLIEYVLFNASTGESAIIIPGFGGILRLLVLRSGTARPAPNTTDSALFSVIEAPESPQALVASETYASAILYPFAGRIQHGLYTFGGVKYALPMNETRRNNALHGLVYDQPFAVVGQEVTDQLARLTLRHTYTGDIEGYPFPFELTITYTLSDDGFMLTYSALNTGPIASPAMFGWHPYFTLKPFPDSSEPGIVESDTILDQMTLDLPVTSVVVLGDDMMPTGAVNPLATRSFTLKNWQVDSSFIIDPTQAEFVETQLRAPQGPTLVVSQETGKLAYLIVFTPPKRDRIAIEPQTAGVNAFNTGEGLVTLDPGNALEGRIWVALR